jgi:predicted phosphate transport protein (TIGR00153 family)
MRLLAPERTIFDDFEDLVRKTAQGCRLLLKIAEDFTDVHERVEQIKTIEEACGGVTHRVVADLHKTFITPIDRNDIYRLVTRLDDIIDDVEAVAERLVLYEIRRPTKELADLSRVLVAATERVLEAVSGLRNLKNPAVTLEKCIEINRLENEADALLRGTLARLFEEEKDPIAIIKWKELYELLERATDRCEDVANVIEGIVLENS